MSKWQSLGNFIGHHMAILAPLAVAAGVIFPGFFGHIENYITLLFAFMTFQGSLNNTFKSLGETFRHPLNMVAIILTSMVFMPVLVHVIASVIFAGNTDLITGATLEYTVPVAVVSFMWVGMFEGDLSLTLATILISTVICPFTIPFSLQLLLGATVKVDAVSMMTKMIVMVAIPAIAGMLLNELTHGWGHETLSPAITPATRVVNVLIIAANSSEMADDVRNMTPALFGMAAFVCVYCIFGFVLGFVIARARKLSAPQLVASCYCTGLRNISAGCVIAAEFFGGSVVFPVMMGTLFQQILAGFFGNFMTSYIEKNALAEGDAEATAK